MRGNAPIGGKRPDWKYVDRKCLRTIVRRQYDSRPGNCGALYQQLKPRFRRCTGWHFDIAIDYPDKHWKLEPEDFSHLGLRNWLYHQRKFERDFDAQSIGKRIRQFRSDSGWSGGWSRYNCKRCLKLDGRCQRDRDGNITGIQACRGTFLDAKCIE